jgi:hypothetical protein
LRYNNSTDVEKFTWISYYMDEVGRPRFHLIDEQLRVDSVTGIHSVVHRNYDACVDCKRQIDRFGVG